MLYCIKDVCLNPDEFYCVLSFPSSFYDVIILSKVEDTKGQIRQTNNEMHKKKKKRFGTTNQTKYHCYGKVRTSCSTSDTRRVAVKQ